jgi:hypothetical protein
MGPHAPELRKHGQQQGNRLRFALRGTRLRFVLTLFTDERSVISVTLVDPRLAARVLRSQAEHLERQADAIEAALKGGEPS